MENQIFKHEKNHLDSTLDKLLDAKKYLEERLNAVGKENLKRLEDLRNDPETSGSDFFMFLEQLNDENRAFNIKDKYTRLEELNSLIEQPYFARIDLKYPNENLVDNVYIGKFGYTEKYPIVTDWRAKIASVYYRYRFPQKNVSYDTPDGKIVKDLTVKRTFEISNGALIKYYNNDLQLDENEIIVDKIEHRTGGVLEDIVETIQESQLDIIEADPRQITIVQGCVGSGKSTVAIHKLSHIFFNHPDVVHPQRSILIAKNQILVGYLSTLFPKLGIFDINYKTIRELLINLIFTEKLKVNIDFEQTDNTPHFDLNRLKKIKQQKLAIDQEVGKQLNDLFKHEDFESFGGYKYSKEFTPYENVNDIIVDLEEELFMQQEGYKDNPKSIKGMLHKENVGILKKIITKLKKIRLELVNGVLLDLAKAYDIDLNSKLNYSEALLYFYLYLELIGLRKFKKYEYCVVDEGQDFSLLEYGVLGKLVLHGRFSILGDLNQSYLDHSIDSWEDIVESIDEAKNAQVFELDTNYRSTKSIIDLANNILSPYTNNYLPKSINRIGPDPIINSFDKPSEMYESFGNQIKTELNKLDKSIGIICFSEESYMQCEDLIDKIKFNKDLYIKLDPNKKISYLPKGIYLSKFEDIKGLEFSKVYIMDLNLDEINNFVEAKKAFVAVTRAMNEVNIFSIT